MVCISLSSHLQVVYLLVPATEKFVFLILSWKGFSHVLDTSPLSGECLTCFLPVCSLAVHLFNVVLWRPKKISVWWMPSVNFLCTQDAFGITSKKCLPSPRSPRFSSLFISEKFILSTLVLRSIICLEWIFAMLWQRGGLGCLHSTLDMQFCQPYLLKRKFLSCCLPWNPLSKHIGQKYIRLLLDSDALISSCLC